MANLVSTLNKKERLYNLPPYVKVINDEVVIDSTGYYSNRDLIRIIHDDMNISGLDTESALLYLEGVHEARIQIKKEDRANILKAILRIVVILISVFAFAILLCLLF